MYEWFTTYIACPIPGGFGLGYVTVLGVVWWNTYLVKRAYTKK